jgi:hypothetical protein
LKGEKKMIEAHVVCDSISPQGKRLTTFKLRYPKFIHGEFMTHRLISRNASSSRAIPVSKLVEEVRSDELRAAPVFWGKNQKGMQAGEELEEPELSEVKDRWRHCALTAAEMAQDLAAFGAHKQVVNRLLEPFSHINVVATATEWDNFFGLRLHKDAQPEMRALAIAMWETRKMSTPKELKPGRWHLPYVDEETMSRPSSRTGTWPLKDELIKISVARCARVSYESFETGKRSTIEEDLKLYDRLLAALKDPMQPLHASPAEHQATPDDPVPLELRDSYRCDWRHPNQHGNFVGWRQYRKMLPGEAVAPLPEEYK